MNNRDYTLDVARALCALEIIAFWHMMDYLPESQALSGISLKAAEYLTNTALAGFTFISGYCLSKYKITNIKDAFLFYKKRLTRFYPLFFLSAVSLLFAGYAFHHPWFVSISQFVTTILGVNMFFPPVAMTLWYFSMIITFYILTPFVLFYSSSKIRQISLSISILILFVIINQFHNVNENLFLYYPFYILGLLNPQSAVNWIYNKKILLALISLIVFSVLSVFTVEVPAGGVWTYCAVVIGFVMLLSLSKIIPDNPITRKAFFFISYSSMVAYLFHRQIYYVLIHVIGDANQELNILTALFISVPIIFIVGYFVQKLYDMLVKKICC